MPQRFLLLLAAFGLLLTGCAEDAEQQPADTADADAYLFPVRQGGQWGYIDRSGAMVVEPQFEAAYPFSEARALVRQGGQYGYIDPNGEVIIEPQFEDGWYFSEGQAPVKDGGAWRLIDASGAVQSTLADSSAPGEAMDRLALDPRFMVEQRYPSSDLERVSVDSLYGYRNSAGEMVIAPRFDEAWQFAEGRARVQQDGQWGFINEQGEFVIAPQFEQAWDFRHGLALVASAGEYAYIDTTGAYVWQPEE